MQLFATFFYNNNQLDNYSNIRPYQAFLFSVGFGPNGRVKPKSSQKRCPVPEGEKTLARETCLVSSLLPASRRRSSSPPLRRSGTAGEEPELLTRAGRTLCAEARNLFDGMAPASKAAKMQEEAFGDDVDRLSALPEDILHHILSFLPSRERELVQRTCFLARNWRNRWKSVPTLRISEDDVFENAHKMNKFVNYLVFLRGPNPLVECEINIGNIHDTWTDDTFSYVDLWVRYAMSCNVQVLRIIIEPPEDLCPLPDKLLVSDHLTTLELWYMLSVEPLLDFSGCPALQELRIIESSLDVKHIIAPSVKRLRILDCTFLDNARARISAPNLIVFKLVSYSGCTPFLDNMPQLMSASIWHDDLDNDCCKSKFEIGGCADVSCQGCIGNRGEGSKSVFLNGLSHASRLKLLTTTIGMFIFRRDLTLCPVFSKLKTLVLSDWCMVANIHALIFFLQHSPVLEKLTLRISKDDEGEVAKGAKYKGAKQPFDFKHLTVEVDCFKISERIKNNLKVLTTCGVPPAQINIYQYSLVNFCSFASLLNDVMGEQA